MTREELDLAVLSKLACGIHLDQFTKKSKQKEQTERRASRTDYFFHGHKICRDFFKFMHSISQDRLTALIQHYKQSGVTPRIHKNAKKPPKHSYSYEDRKSVLDFIVNFTEVNGIELPGRTPKHWITKGKLLPTNCTKKSVFELYKKARQDQRLKIVGERIFYALWQKLLPFVRTMPPATDLCSTCEQGTMKLRRSSNRPDAEKNEVLQELILHQSTVAEERDYYKTLCARIKIQVQQQNLEENHISFNYAQQVHYPYSPRQQGPIYFKTPRKCGIFGVNSEPNGVQCNFLIDERHSTGKGANAVISMLHFYLNQNGIGEKILFMHADNCTGQNKNNMMMWYLMWRVLTDLHAEINLSFLIAGHTKFSPDGGFGLIKRLYNKSEINCLMDIVEVVESSSKMNSAVLVGTENSDESYVPTYDWSTYLGQYFSKLPALKCYHHFKFTKGGIACKKKQ